MGVNDVFLGDEKDALTGDEDDFWVNDPDNEDEEDDDFRNEDEVKGSMMDCLLGEVDLDFSMTVSVDEVVDPQELPKKSESRLCFHNRGTSPLLLLLFNFLLTGVATA